MIDETFSVVQYFPDGTYEYVRRYVGAEEAVKAAHFYSHNLACQLGITQRVIIEDGGGSIVFEWKRGEGVTFPPEAAGRV